MPEELESSLPSIEDLEKELEIYRIQKTSANTLVSKMPMRDMGIEFEYLMVNI